MTPLQEAAIVTIDGPAGSGKSSVARLLAERLGFEFLDTGAMYRAVGWCCQQRGIQLDDLAAVAEVADGIQLQMQPTRLLVDGHDATSLIRTPQVSRLASLVAAIPAVRDALVLQQRRAALGKRIVTEGRDQGSVVFPHAGCKFYLTASAEVRAQRRQLELKAAGQDVPYELLLREQEERDERDSTRSHSPLVRPDDAIEVDSSELSPDEVLDRMEQIARGRLRPHVSPHSRPTRDLHSSP